MGHEWYKCPQPCHCAHCQFCMGGLASCTVCDGFEGTLSRECCGRKITEGEGLAIWKGGLDYRDGEWVMAEKGHAVRDRDEWKRKATEAKEIIARMTDGNHARYDGMVVTLEHLRERVATLERENDNMQEQEPVEVARAVGEDRQRLAELELAIRNAAERIDMFMCVGADQGELSNLHGDLLEVLSKEKE